MKRILPAGIPLLTLALATTIVLWPAYVDPVGAHCQIPCGIYDDSARIARLHEDSATIAKAIGQINELAGKGDAQSINQALRWITTKETHAAHIIEVVSEYFLTQKIKPVAPGSGRYKEYLKTLADHHAVMVAAMRTKQKADPATADALHDAIDALAAHYKK
jgi:nickel superoxide dismutase